ncbi:MAG: LPP20 family lipoprotein [Spirochaetaceae bacterium]|nr:LPP20 family lipoprotein [Spirochaetaceae bacterium]
MLSSFINKKSVLFLSFFLLSFSVFAARVPEWYEHRSTVYPDGFYITAVGEGNSKLEAELAALANISMYFNIKTDVANALERTMMELDGKNYDFSKQTNVNESTKVSSSSEFFGVQFAECFFVDGKYTTLAYIERDLAFDVYLQRIKDAASKLESLLLVAEDYNNPLSGLEAAEEAVPIANYAAELMKMARIVKKSNDRIFASTEALVQRSYTAKEICRQNLVFQLVVQNDYENMVYTTISDLLEGAGYALSSTNGTCTVPVLVTVEKEESEAGVFLYCNLVVKIADGTGSDFFSYSRSFPKKGGKTQRQAYNRAFQAIQAELNATFMAEFNARLKR